MWQALIKLVEKCACCHKWELHRRMSTYDDYSGNRPSKVEETLICQKCGKIKKIKL